MTVRPCVLIRDDTFDELLLDGVLSVDRRRPGVMTRHRVPDRSHVADGITIDPEEILIEALISPNPPGEDTTTGPARIAEVLDWLAEARREGVTVSLQEPDRPQDVDLVIERYSDISSRLDAPALSIALSEARFAERSRIELAERETAASGAPVPSERALDGAEEQEGGRRSASLLSTIADFFTEQVGGGAP